MPDLMTRTQRVAAPVPPPGAALHAAVRAFAEGRFVMLEDDTRREQPACLLCRADTCTPDQINFLAREARGIVQIAMAPALVDRLGLAPQVSPGWDGGAPLHTVSIEAAQGIDTGISAADRAVTIRAACAPGARPADVVTPGHVFPLRAAPGGLAERAGIAEAAVDVARRAGVAPAAVICELLAPSGEVACGDIRTDIAARLGLHRVSIGALRRA